MNRKIALAVGAGVLASGGVLASAATLGTLGVKTLGTSSNAVAGCGSNDITIRWNDTAPVYSGAATPANSTFTTSDVVVNVPNACVGATLDLAVADNSGGAALATGQVNNLTAGNNVVTLSAPVDSKQVLQTTVTIYNQS
ncbi:MAG: hypothetical protein MUF33_02640 [Candidatus Nanopelagicales bacterium]|jgi:hypothetical protein|nr:hypothetical protein [Candidatus Nanopelagicales bacterium]